MKSTLDLSLSLKSKDSDSNSNSCSNAARQSFPVVINDEDESRRSDPLRSRNSSPLEADAESAVTPTSGNASKKRVYHCNYCNRMFYKSQALGGHQNAHKRKRSMNEKAAWISQKAVQFVWVVPSLPSAISLGVLGIKAHTYREHVECFTESCDAPLTEIAVGRCMWPQLVPEDASSSDHMPALVEAQSSEKDSEKKANNLQNQELDLTLKL